MVILCKLYDHIDNGRITNYSFFIPHRLSLAEYHEQEEIFKLRIGHLKKVQLLLLTSGTVTFSCLTV